MCSTNPGAMMLPYGLKVPVSNPYLPGSQMALELQRAQQFYDYSTRMHYGIRGYPSALGLPSYQAHPSVDQYLQHYLYKDPRIRYLHEEPKPNHSYIGLIAMAILSSRDKKLVLSDIYQWILDNYPYFRTRGPGWRNSIRHNLSLNDCFIKSGRSANGKGHYWAIHPANVDDFQKGDFRRRRAQRRVRRHMGLAVPDDDESPVSSPSETNWPDEDADLHITNKCFTEKIPNAEDECLDITNDTENSTPSLEENGSPVDRKTEQETLNVKVIESERLSPKKRRNFDMDSLLAPDEEIKRQKMADEQVACLNQKGRVDEDDTPLDVLTESKDSQKYQNTAEKTNEKENVLDLSSHKEDLNERNSTQTNPEKGASLHENNGLLFNSSLRGFTSFNPQSSSVFQGSTESLNSLQPYFPAFPVMGLKNGLQHSFFLSKTISQIQQNHMSTQFSYRLPSDKGSRLPDVALNRQMTN
ncbi:forkhead box protein A4-like [Saccostrea echinata]|uniref:forkhead box protein A4-like n=1 Tax=Saccostrea echinata TaxID=191078 RepID=UPI002A82F476|nr:forkhead box protein A4-like [Saccostrea echinata]